MIINVHPAFRTARLAVGTSWKQHGWQVPSCAGAQFGHVHPGGCRHLHPRSLCRLEPRKLPGSLRRTSWGSSGSTGDVRCFVGHLGPWKSPRSHFQVYPIYPCSSCVDVSWCTSLIFALENNTHFKPPAAIQLVFLWPSPWNKAVWLTVVATGPSAWTGCPWSPWCRAKSTSFLMVSWIASMMLWSRVTLCWSKALWPSTAWKDCKRGTGKLQSATSAHLIWDRQDNQIGLSEEHLLKLSTAKTSAPHGFKPARNADSHLDCIFFEYFNFACSEVEEYLHVFPL